MQRLYRAVRVHAAGPPSVLAVESVAAPNLSPGQVLVRVHAVGINPVETYQRSGAYAKLPPYPFTPGNDAAGVVEAIAEDVKTVKPGDRVYTLRCVSGAYAELAVAEARLVQPLPPCVSFLQGAALGVPYHTAYRALLAKGGLKPAQTVLVHGATGGVGIAACQIARSVGAQVIGTAGSDAGAALIAPWCSRVLRHGGPAGAVEREVLEATGGRGADLIVEMLANVNLPADTRMVAPGGKILVVGNRGPLASAADPLVARELMSREASIVGVMLWLTTDAEYAESSAFIAAGLRAGSLSPVVGSVHEGLDAAPAAHVEVVEHAGGSRGKIVMRVRPDEEA